MHKFNLNFCVGASVGLSSREHSHLTRIHPGCPAVDLLCNIPIEEDKRTIPQAVFQQAIWEAGFKNDQFKTAVGDSQADEKKEDKVDE